MKLISMSCTHKRLPSLTDVALRFAEDGFMALQPDATVRSIRLIDFNLQFCEGEDTCLDPAVGRCVLDDGFDELLELIAGADCLLLAMPVYGGNVPSVLKMFQERLKSTMTWPRRPLGNIRVATIVHSRSLMTETALGALGPWLTRLNSHNVATVSFTQYGFSDLDHFAQSKFPEMCTAVGQQLALALSPDAAPTHPIRTLPLLPTDSRPRCGTV